MYFGFKNHKPLLVTELIFSYNLKANGKILKDFYGGNQGDVNFQNGPQKSSLQLSMGFRKHIKSKSFKCRRIPEKLSL